MNFWWNRYDPLKFLWDPRLVFTGITVLGYNRETGQSTAPEKHTRCCTCAREASGGQHQTGCAIPQHAVRPDRALHRRRQSTILLPRTACRWSRAGSEVTRCVS